MEAGLYTLDEASGLTGLSVEALRKRVTRRKLEAVRGNDGRVRVRLDDQAIADLKRDLSSGQRGGRPGGRPDGQKPDISGMIRAFEAANAALRERAEAAETRANRLEAENRELRSRADRAEGMIEGLKAARAKPSGGFAAWWRSMREAFRS